MSKPIVAVVGRPNVGKSTLFNKLCGQRLAIVEDTPGITRDRIFANCEWNGHEFLLVDTGGIEPKATEGILAHMREQAQIAIDTADCIIMVVDVRDGLTAADEDVAHMLRLDVGKHDHRAACKHEPQRQLADVGQQILAPRVQHGQAAHRCTQHKTAAAKQAKQHLMQRFPHRVAFHKGKAHQQKPRKQGPKPCRQALFRAFFARR